MVEITLLDIISRVVCGVDGREDPVDIIFDIIIDITLCKGRREDAC